MRKIFQQIHLFVLGVFLPRLVFAQTAAVIAHNDNAPSVGQVADNLSVATGFFNDVLSNIFYIIGIALITASIIRYRDYKQNSSETPLRKPVIIFLAGIFIGLFPLIVNFINYHTSTYQV